MKPQRFPVLFIALCAVGLGASQALGSPRACAHSGELCPTGVAQAGGRQTSSSYDELVLSTGPVAYWALNGRGREVDLSGHGHAGAYVGGQPTTTDMPNGDRASSFNGSNEFVSVPSAPAFSIATHRELTWEGWIRPETLQFPDGPSGYVNWIGKCRDYAPTCEWEGRIYNQLNQQGRCSRISAYAFNPNAGLGSGAYWQQSSCDQIHAGEWLYIVAEYQTATTPSTCDGRYPGTIDIWVNGVEWNSAFNRPTGCMSQYGIEPSPRSSPLTIGTVAGDSWFKGAIGKVAIYDRLLSPSEIAAQYTAMTGHQPGGSCEAVCELS